MSYGSRPSYTEYYRILGLSPGASLEEIKRAYRARAKQYHPDLNKAPDAQERFIEVNEAYEFLLHLHTTPPPADGTTRSASRRRPPYHQPSADELFREWMAGERRKARARAAAAARKRYEEFRKSRIYRTSQIISAVYDYIFIGLGVIMIAGSVAGLIAHLNEPPDPVTQTRQNLGTDILSTVILSLIGILFIIFAGANIRERRTTKDDR